MGVLQLLGVPRVKANGRRQSPQPPQKAFVIAALLCLEPAGTLTRTRLAEILWTGAPSSTAMANLRQLIASIRRWQRQARLEVLVFDRTTVSAGQACRNSDLRDILGLRRIDSAADLNRYVQTYSGDLLSGGELTADAELGRRIIAERQRLADQFVTTTLQATQAFGGRDAEQILFRLREIAPGDESVFRALADHLLRRGARRQLSIEYDKLATFLAAEYRVRPESQTMRLVRRPAVEPRDEIGTEAGAGGGGPLPRVLLLPPPPPEAGQSHRLETLVEAFIDDVTIGLCRLRTFAMLAPHSARQIVKLAESGAFEPFGAEFVIRTRIVQRGRAATEPHLSFLLTRSDTGEVLIGDYVRIHQDSLGRGRRELSEAIALRLAGRIAEETRWHADSAFETSAYAAYLFGCHEIQTYDLPNVRRARKRFQQALAIAPGFVPALAMLSRTLSMEWLLLARRDTELLVKAGALAEEATRLDPLAPDGHRERGHTAIYLNDLDASLSSYEKALERAPHHADTLVDVADVSLHAGDTTRAKVFIDRAIELNPIVPDNYLWTSGAIDFFSDRPAQAFATLSRMTNTEQVARLLAASAAEIGLADEAARHRDRWLARYPDFRADQWHSIVPMRSRQHVEKFHRAMRRAGFK